MSLGPLLPNWFLCLEHLSSGVLNYTILQFYYYQFFLLLYSYLSYVCRYFYSGCMFINKQNILFLYWYLYHCVVFLSFFMDFILNPIVFIWVLLSPLSSPICHSMSFDPAFNPLALKIIIGKHGSTPLGEGIWGAQGPCILMLINSLPWQWPGMSRRKDRPLWGSGEPSVRVCVCPWFSSTPSES